jgi:hypothetical protein
VTKVLIIGWRATEEHFLALLRSHLQPGVEMHIVAGTKEEAENTRVRIYRAMLNNPPHAHPAEGGGFTDFILSDTAEQYLSI